MCGWLQLIKRGAQIDVCDYLGKSPLLRACEASRLDLVEALLDLGVSPNPHDLRCAHFPLQTAIRRNDAEIVKVRRKPFGWRHRCVIWTNIRMGCMLVFVDSWSLFFRCFFVGLLIHEICVCNEFSFVTRRLYLLNCSVCSPEEQRWM